MRILLAVAAAMVVAGCGAGDDALSPADSTVGGGSSRTVIPSFGRTDVVGTWIVTRREHGVDEADTRVFVPMASPLPTYRFDADGSLSGFDGCNSHVAPWSFTSGRFTTTESTNATAAATAILCEDSNGHQLPTVGPSPERLEQMDGTIIMVFAGEDGITAHAQRLSDLSTPPALAGSTWILAIDGPDVTVEFGRDDRVEFRDDTSTCAAGSYTYDVGVLVLDLETTPDQCPGAGLDARTQRRLEVASYTDRYVADTILLVPATGGAVRLFPASAYSEASDEADTIAISIATADDFSGD